LTDRNRRFAEKVIVITGAGSGIGRTAALAFAREGGSVVIGDINETDGAETARQILESGGNATVVRCDVRDAEDVAVLIARAVADFGGVDVLYNNAGVVRYGTVEELSVEDWDFQLDINLKGTFLTCKYAIPEMRKRGGGAIINTASVQAFASQKTVPAYAASKGGVVSLTTTIALDHADDNIRCNCIAPGTIRTPMVGNLVLFLASDEAAFCTGGCYRVDGGLLSPLFNG
jgi:NAD(P)-dependent dehydrogenase (short-subunit alcohol dehydrogenase family)